LLITFNDYGYGDKYEPEVNLKEEGMGLIGLPSQAHAKWLMCRLGVILSLVLCGCTPPASHLIETQAAVASLNQATYLLGPEDTLEISVWKEPDLTKQLVVRPDGKITYPLIGEVQAAGRTVKQLQEEILKRLEKYVTDAHVTVILLKAQNYKVYVTGKVNKPGDFVIGKPVNVMQAISMAGGLTPFASPGSIMVLRTVGGKEEVFPFNYKEVAKGQFLEQNRMLMPGDVVVVP
jgi:polysaccharide export outer membrane protein